MNFILLLITIFVIVILGLAGFIGSLHLLKRSSSKLERMYLVLCSKLVNDNKIEEE